MGLPSPLPARENQEVGSRSKTGKEKARLQSIIYKQDGGRNVQQARVFYAVIFCVFHRHAIIILIQEMANITGKDG